MYAPIVMHNAVKGRISVTGTDNANRTNTKVTFENNAPFRSCMSKIENTSVEDLEDLAIFVSMYNLLEYSDNYSITSGSLQNYYRDEVNDDENENDDNHIMINNNKIAASKSFEYEQK